MGLKLVILEIDLTQIPEVGPIKFLYAETSATATSSLVIVHYADNGQKQPYGLRLDLDKGVFLDHLGDPQIDATVSSMANMIASEVLRKLSGHKAMALRYLGKIHDAFAMRRPRAFLSTAMAELHRLAPESEHLEEYSALEKAFDERRFYSALVIARDIVYQHTGKRLDRVTNDELDQLARAEDQV